MVFIFSAYSFAGTGNGNYEEKKKLLDEVEVFLQKASNASKEKDKKESYNKAITRMETLVDNYDVRNSKLFYNLGNAYFSVGEMGRAILNYRRSERINPNDSNLVHNLGYARSMRKDRVDLKADTRIMKILLFWHYDFSSYVRTVIFVIFFVLFWLAMILRRMKIFKFPAGGLVALLILWIAFASSLGVDEYCRRNMTEGVVIKREVVARKGDGESYAKSFSEPIHAGTEVLVKEKRGHWMRVELVDGRECWLPFSAVEII
jgi:tetratricopeptide (TPR) repeat protein